MLVTVKSREVQRALLAEMRGDPEAAQRHFLASAHLELVLAADYEQAGDSPLSFRSQLSAASCFCARESTSRRDAGLRICGRLIPAKPRRFSKWKWSWPGIFRPPARKRMHHRLRPHKPSSARS